MHYQYGFNLHKVLRLISFTHQLWFTVDDINTKEALLEQINGNTFRDVIM